MRERFSVWKRDTTDNASDRAIALRLGWALNKPGRHLTDAEPPVAESVIEFARGYGVNPVTGLVEAGHLTQEEVDAAGTDAADALTTATEAQLLTELLRRASERERRDQAKPRTPKGLIP